MNCVRPIGGISVALATTLVSVAAGCSDDDGGERADTEAVSDAASGADASETSGDPDDTGTPLDAEVGPDSATDAGEDSANTPDDASEELSPPDLLVCNQENWTSMCEYEDLQKAADEVSAGQVVGIRGGVYDSQCAKWSTDDVTVRGVDGRPHLKDEVCGFKGIFVVTSGTENFTVRDIEFSGMAIPEDNGANAAAIRHQGRGLEVHDIYAHDGQEGILASAGDYTVRIEGSTFENLGKNGRAHDIYVNEVTELTVRDSEFLSAKSQGHEFKSRARRTVVECSTVASLEGTDSRTIDVSNGGVTVLRNNVIQQGPKSVNSTMIGYGPEGYTAEHARDLTLRNNVLINDLGEGTFVSVNEGDQASLTIEDNEFYGDGTELNAGGKTLSASNETGQTATDRENDFGAPPSLPDPPNCP